MAVNSQGIYYPQGSDPFDPAGDMQALADSTKGRLILPAASVSARNSLAIALAPITTANPLFVYRSDTSEVEHTTDGTNWRSISATVPSIKFRKTTTRTGLGSGIVEPIYGMTVVAADSIASPTSWVTVNTSVEEAVPIGGVFTIQKTRRYRIDAYNGWSNQVTSAPAQVNIGIVVNGTTIRDRWVAGGTASPRSSEVSATVKLTVGTKVKIHLQQVSSAALDVQGSSTLDHSGVVFTDLGPA